MGNNGRSKHGRGMTAMLRCSNCGRSVPKDKAIKRFTVRNIVDASSQRDIRDASLYQQYAPEALHQDPVLRVLRDPQPHGACAAGGDAEEPRRAAAPELRPEEVSSAC